MFLSYYEALTEELVERQNTTITSDMVMQGLALAIIVALLAILITLVGLYQYRYADPYIRHVLALEGDVVQGRAIFQMNCSTCHGLNADGAVGPSLHEVSERRTRVGLIKQVVSGQTPPMPQFQPSPEE
ncbi:MAG: cytochrome c, partial [Cyanothece sp. SIO2G6]|nr:cytochrome c [Cyanothece sp. SIO2G6]